MHLTRTLMPLAAAVAFAVAPSGVKGAEDPETKVLSDGSTVVIFRNTSTQYEWPVPSGVSEIRYLVVGGGGGGGSTYAEGKFGGGGGGGCVKDESVEVDPLSATTVTVKVGAGGSGAVGNAGGAGENGGDSSLTIPGREPLVALGGGGGGGQTSKSVGVGGQSHGTGGGGYNSSKNNSGDGKHPGGKGGAGSDNNTGGAGGGAAGDPDGNAVETTEGAGVISDITGQDVEYGRGAKGAWVGDDCPQDKTVGTDGLGEGGRTGLTPGGGYKGGDGVVIIRYATSSVVDLSTATVTVMPTSKVYTGEVIQAPEVTVKVDGKLVESSHYTLTWDPSPLKEVGSYNLTVAAKGSGYTGSKTETGAFAIKPKSGDDDWGYELTDGNYTVRVYTNICSSGFTWTVPSGVTEIEYLVVGGGGGGGSGINTSQSVPNRIGGGGGAGGLVGGTRTMTAGTILTVKVGEGGAGGTDGKEGVTTAKDGGTSSLGIQDGDAIASAPGGGAGGDYYCNGREGACGGGGGRSGQGAAGTCGGAGNNGGPTQAGGGGGMGGNASETSIWVGGPGVISSITGSGVTYAAGGIGAGNKHSEDYPGEDGTGNGGNGGLEKIGNKGGDGVVIIRYEVKKSRGLILMFSN